MQKILNKQLFNVNDNEFPLLKHYSTLQLYPQQGIFEREIGLIRDIINIYDINDSTFINIEISHGGYLPIKLLPFANNIYIVTKNEQEINNLNKNCELYDTEQKIKIVDQIEKIEKKENQIQIIRFDSTFEEIGFNKYDIKVFEQFIILSYNPINTLQHKCYNLSNSDLLINIPNNLVNIFEDKFRYYLNLNLLDYDNLIHLCMIVKDAGDGFRDILEKNLQYIDEWTILDTGSTDNTVEIIKDVLKTKKGTLYEEPFMGFRESRNRCLELVGQSCKFSIMLDDTYILKGNVREFLNILRSDQFADSYNIFVDSNENVYGSNRILKTDRKLKYIYKIHEIIQDYNNVVVQLPLNEMSIDDIPSEYMRQRTSKRKQYDLELLHETFNENTEIPRTLYYITQTYCEMRMWNEAFEYAKKRIEHPNEGYREEITDCYLICGNIAEQEFKWEWEKCEEIYLNCYNHDKSRADALYCIGTHYIGQNINTAYEYLKKAFELDISPTATSNLRVNIYNKLLPFILTSICYQVGDHKLGQQAAEKYLKYNQKDQTILSFLNIFKLLNSEKNNKNSIKKDNKKDILCFVADGGFNNWSGSSINNEGVGGSETYIIEMSRNIAKITNYDVYVFCKTDNDEVFENVKYRNLNKYIEFLNNHKIHTCIISRFSEYVPITTNNDVENVYLVVHDLALSGNVIPTNDKLKGIFCMSEWHKNYFLNSFQMMKDITHVFPNGINIDKYDNVNVNKKKNSFIYSSFANRGLINLLKMFPKIREILPDATLDIFCDTRNNWVRSVSNDEMNLVEIMLNEQKDYITNHGWVTKDVLTNYFLQSEFWFYPCTFQETFCVTALEAAGSETLAITNNLAALNDTVGDRGILIPGNANDIEWQNEAINSLKNIINNQNKKTELINKNRKWAEEHDWKKLADTFVNKYIGKGKEIINDDKFTKYYSPIQENINYLCNRFSHCKKVLEIGPGFTKFPLATHFVDHIDNKNLSNLTIMDITKDKLPFNDDEFDFVYCRHVLEDINDPQFVIKELIRVSKVIYIETPSPLAEVTRHVDGASPHYRGYIHHRSLIWVHNNSIKILPKYPIIEYINVDNCYKKLENPYYWNTYFIWNKANGNPNVNILQYDIDYNIHTNYEQMIKQSIIECKQSIKMHMKNINSITSNIEYCGMLNWSSNVPNGSKQIFENILDKFKNKSCNILEIGTYTGTSIINMLKYLPNAKATVVDMWEDYEENNLLQSIKKNKIEGIFLNNIKIGNVIDRVSAIKGDSKDILVNLLLNNNKYDFIYVDGSHKCLDCYSDMIFSWELLSSGGILGIDDYLWKPENNANMLNMPYYAVEHFMERYKGKYSILDMGYRVFLQKM